MPGCGVLITVRFGAEEAGSVSHRELGDEDSRGEYDVARGHEDEI